MGSAYSTTHTSSSGSSSANTAKKQTPFPGSSVSATADCGPSASFFNSINDINANEVDGFGPLPPKFVPINTSNRRSSTASFLSTSAQSDYLFSSSNSPSSPSSPRGSIWLPPSSIPSSRPSTQVDSHGFPVNFGVWASMD